MQGGGRITGSPRKLEKELRELRCRTQAQEQCIEQYQTETEKILSLPEGNTSEQAMHGMMKVWLRDARQQSDDLRYVALHDKHTTQICTHLRASSLHAHQGSDL